MVNYLAKIHYRWGQNADVVLRMPCGAGVGAGPFHSQTNEAWFTKTPGLIVVYPAFPYDAKGLLISSIENPNPVLFFEHKALYRSIRGDVPEGYFNIEIGKAKLLAVGSDISVITYSFQAGTEDMETIIQYCLDSKSDNIELMGNHVERTIGMPRSRRDSADWRANVSMKEFKKVKKEFEQKGINIFAYKPYCMSPRNKDEEIEYAMKATKALGADYVTAELTDETNTKRILEKNQILALPTETVYGLAGNAYSHKSVKRIYSLKKRPQKNPLIIHYYNLELLKKDAEYDKNFLKL